jgi:hypothetical protein
MSQASDASTTAQPDPNAKYASLLASDERVLLARQRHWFTFVNAARWFVLVLVAGVLAGFLNDQIDDEGLTGPISWVLGKGFIILVLAGLGGIGWYYLEWRVERYLVTTRRVIETGGVISKYSKDTALPMITDMIVHHPWIGRILGFGEIDLLTASEQGTNKIRFLPEADEFKRTLLDARHEYEMEIGGGRVVHDAAPAPAPAPVAAPAPAPAPAPAVGRITAAEVDASITHLADLRDRGLITPAEFESKKQDLLDRL